MMNNQSLAKLKNKIFTSPPLFRQTCLSSGLWISLASHPAILAFPFKYQNNIRLSHQFFKSVETSTQVGGSITHLDESLIYLISFGLTG